MDLDAALECLAVDPAAPLDVAEVALGLARDEYPCLDVDACLAEVDGMAHEARRYVRGSLEARVRGLCRYIFHEMGFHGNQGDYYDPRNSYLNEVLERRTGIPISLSALAMAVGARAGLDVRGVALPGHFVAKAVDGAQEQLFDPYHGGRLLTAQDCETLVEQATGQSFRATAERLGAAPLALVVVRMLTNLKAIYLKQGDLTRAIRVMQRQCQVNPQEPNQRRDLGAALMHTGQPGRAIDQLAAYLAALPDADDAEVVGELLTQARREIAGWN
jgi:regulator of sirC expression with transglutaminase-like and TPR domain